jgi:hypothetical protein
MRSILGIAVFGFMGALLAGGSDAVAGSHTWEVWEIFSNADGTVQFVELKETHNDQSEWLLHFHQVTGGPSGGNSYQILHDVSGNTAGRYYLLATAGFQALPGAPTPDEIIPSNFIRIAQDGAMSYSGSYIGQPTWTPGTLPTDGIHSYTRTVPGGALSVAVNSPENYANVTGSVDASLPPPGVPNLLVNKLDPNGSSLSVSWSNGSCSDSTFNHEILFGQRSNFPAAPTGIYSLLGGSCGIGSPPFTWTSTPSASDGSGLIWFLVVTNKSGTKEGPWGNNSAGERNGPGTRGASNGCATDKDVSSSCGR